jgi:hypothetical protein
MDLDDLHVSGLLAEWKALAELIFRNKFAS